MTQSHLYLKRMAGVAPVWRIGFRRYEGEIRDQLGGSCSGSGDR